MSQISNVSDFSQNINSQDKSSAPMQVGQVFNAKVIETKNQNGEVIIDLGSGNKISAKVDGNVNADLSQTNKFLVEGYDNGEIKVRLLPSENNSPNLDSKIDEIIKQCFGSSANEQDYAIVKTLMDCGVPLTKDNVIYAKNLLDFQNKMSSTQSSSDQFIKTYLESRNIDLNSVEGKNVSEKISQFLNELKGCDLKDIATLMENNIDVNSKNINSFNSLFKGGESIFSELSEIKSQIENALPSEVNSEVSIKNDVLKIIMGSSKEGGSIMPGIVNVNNKVDTESRNTRKLIVEVGDVFS
ncbi:MAG: hypothetical protein PHX70_05740 [Clostridium sp.]|nr:hypothetical protein [Clostridium sp.]